EEAPDAADRARPVEIEVAAFAIARHHGTRQELSQLLGDTDRTGPRSTAAMRTAERLVGIEMHHVGPEISGAGHADDGVHVGPVQINQPAAIMHAPRNLADLSV